MIEEYKNRVDLARALYGEESVQYKKAVERLEGMEAQFGKKKENVRNVRKSRKA